MAAGFSARGLLLADSEVWVSLKPKPENFEDDGLLARLRAALELQHESARTVEAYLEWTRRFVAFHRGRHPSVMGAPEVGAFLSHARNAPS